MLKIVGCFTEAHDFWLVGLAALTCAVSAITCIELLRHARKAPLRIRAIWLAVAAMAGGSGIWATHFIAMLAFEPNMPSAYELGLTGLSLVYAIALTGLGLAMALSAVLPFGAALGGVVLGVGIAAMHYTGMAAFEIAGHIEWDPVLVAVSLACGAVLGGAALPVALSAKDWRGRMLGAVLLLVAICSHHFVAMGAVTIVPDPAVSISASAIPARWLAMGIALASLTILALAGAALVLDIRDRRQLELTRERLHSLANAAVEGLVVCRGDVIVSANNSFGRLVGLDAGSLSGTALSRFLPASALRIAPDDAIEQPVEAELSCAEGGTIPVELIVRPVTYGNKPHYAIAVRDLRARRKAEGQIEFLAHHDALTGLANRASFNQRLDQELKLAQATGGKLAVLCLDLDRFKEVNDLFGHAAGDAMLVTVANTISALLGESQLMARLGGDEFAVILPCSEAVAAGRLAEQILDVLDNDQDGAAPVIATSVGIAVYPDDADERALLLSYADTALYRAKSEGRGTYRFFEPKMGVQVRERRLLEHDMRHAVARGEMHLVYQPQTDVKDGAVIGFEVLLRWQHPQRGAASPAMFIPIAEESGAILQIGEWVLREACREAATWTNPLKIAVNVSGVQLHAPHFAQLVHEVLFQTGLKPERLEIEITETALIRDPGRAQSTLRQLKALGVRIAMDDFGTGYSSLSNLRAYPFDKIKIDSSFIRAVDDNEQAAAIVRSVLGLGRGLGLPVLAEGVETQAQLSFLAEEKCHAAQGYLMGRPARIDAFTALTHGAAAAASEGALVA
ncbi:sensor domain-containing diguanylate cyclase [Methylobacterium gossipiicola]|uniref:PAS domain S-box-containing protein/diguanylate cyclase (GGDEF) domain-containing protein n=1 Tax=Methylobacterium gossipiicola TaxID=582675 RepID=A0A1I2W918_9HYPH|nr:EAL domain-containing protein [Methylobacterium gossipiicola]SFG97883.1 PAS domain S-box-containing protein/diguanylate cyclase (GGDEF) domain-containing protein [Methylobacterium gossipiicola]